MKKKYAQFYKTQPIAASLIWLSVATFMYYTASKPDLINRTLIKSICQKNVNELPPTSCLNGCKFVIVYIKSLAIFLIWSSSMALNLSEPL